ncbi:small ribosomal subunit protein bS6m-like isoform X1 [Mytilus trossulus]|uniref:small ribosomal subunit protein bS6m-like isoform X1 n=1 Tax=Mytilus trossulus TaxID=6551 RepID=UPI003007CA3F
MPPYELALILRGTLARPEVAQALKKGCQNLLSNGSVVRKIENLGQRELPYYMRAHNTIHKEGHYFLLNFDSPVESLKPIKQGFKEHRDVVRAGLERTDQVLQKPCLDGPCQFGEIPDPLHEKRIYRQKVTKRLAKTYGKFSLNLKWK